MFNTECPYELQPREWIAWSLVEMGNWDGPRWSFTCVLTHGGRLHQRVTIRENRMFGGGVEIHKKRAITLKPGPRTRLARRITRTGFGVLSAPQFIHTDGAHRWIVTRTPIGIHHEEFSESSESGPTPFADTFAILESIMPYRFDDFMEVSKALREKQEREWGRQRLHQHPSP